MHKKPAKRFSKNFLWGASTSAHQVEGSNHNQWSEWEKQNAKSLAAAAQHQYGDVPRWDRHKKLASTPANYISAKAVDHYNRYQADFDLLASLHMNAFRFSIEWSRIEPQEGAWNAEAIDHYKTYIAELKTRGIEPVATLFHFTLPVWFADMGGFEKRKNVAYFVRFVQKIMTEMGAHLRYVITINEPNVYASESYKHGTWPPAVQDNRLYLRVLRNLAVAHNQSSKAIKRIQVRAKVSVAYNSSYVYAGDDAKLSRTAASVLQWCSDDYFLKKVVKQCDFLGLNYYFSNRVYGYRVHNPNTAVSDLGWDVAPENIEHALVRLWDRYHLPILITENGIADSEDMLRKQWIQATLVAMQSAMESDVKLLGYLHWSLLDNFEWAQGRWPRFGLAEVDYRTYERRLRPSAMWFAKVIKQLRDSHAR